MKIELLYVPGCPHRSKALQLIRDSLAFEKIDARIDEIAVPDRATAERIQFPGSPTIRINGADIDPDTSSGRLFGLTCRVYPGSVQKGLPAARLIFDALRKNISRDTA